MVWDMGLHIYSHLKKRMKKERATLERHTLCYAMQVIIHRTDILTMVQTEIRPQALPLSEPPKAPVFENFGR